MNWTLPKKFLSALRNALTTAMLAFWLVPIGQAQTQITINPGFQHILQNNSSNQTIILKVPANVGSLTFQMEGASSNSVTYTINFQKMTADTNLTSGENLNCTQGALSSGTTLAPLPNSNFTGLILSGLGFANSFNCPITSIGRIQVQITITAGTGTYTLSCFATSAAIYVSPEKTIRWSQISTPAVSLQASASRPALPGGKHVADCVSYSAGAIAAPAATQLTLNLRDGASGAGTIIWSKTLTIPATAAPHYDFSFCGLNLIGSTNTAMTLEFSALLTNEFESVDLTGYDVQ